MPCRKPSICHIAEPTDPACPHCGEPEYVAVAEVFANGEFLVETCCEGMHQAVSEFLAHDPRQAAHWLNARGDGDGASLGELTGLALRRVADNDGQLLLDWNLQLIEVEFATVRDFVVQHHDHNPSLTGWRYGFGITNGPEMIGVASIGNPVGRGFVGKGVLEVNRVCIRRDIARARAWNACSTLYGAAAREAKQRGMWKIITYTRDDEAGVSLKAAGWIPEARVRARKRGWDCDARPRERGEAIGKIRWARYSNPKEHASRARDAIKLPQSGEEPA